MKKKSSLISSPPRFLREEKLASKLKFHQNQFIQNWNWAESTYTVIFDLWSRNFYLEYLRMYSFWTVPTCTAIILCNFFIVYSIKTRVSEQHLHTFFLLHFPSSGSTEQKSFPWFYFGSCTRAFQTRKKDDNHDDSDHLLVSGLLGSRRCAKRFAKLLLECWCCCNVSTQL